MRAKDSPTPPKAVPSGITHTVSLTTDDVGGGGYLMTLALDDQWLHDPARVSPIVIDPTLTTGQSGQPRSVLDRERPVRVDELLRRRLLLGRSRLDREPPTQDFRSCNELRVAEASLYAHLYTQLVSVQTAATKTNGGSLEDFCDRVRVGCPRSFDLECRSSEELEASVA